MIGILCLCAWGCSRFSGSGGGAIVIPTKDDAFVLDGRTLSIGGYQAIRKELSKSERGPIKTEVALWIAEAAVAKEPAEQVIGRLRGALRADHLGRRHVDHHG